MNWETLIVANQNVVLTSEFEIGVILSLIHNRRMARMDRIFLFLQWMTCDSTLSDSQFKHAVRSCGAELSTQHPDLAKVVIPNNLYGHPLVTGAWLASRYAFHGSTRTVTRKPVDQTNPLKSLMFSGDTYWKRIQLRTRPIADIDVQECLL